jgi:hypothetical protein
VYKFQSNFVHTSVRSASYVFDLEFVVLGLIFALVVQIFLQDIFSMRNELTCGSTDRSFN